jgi:hypothetical protein
MNGERTKQLNSSPVVGFTKCHICGKDFFDLGTHPLTCGQRACAMEAGKRGWWAMTQQEQLRLPYDPVKKN